MCGIAGKINFDKGNSVCKHSLEMMTRMLRHRGPDDEGYYFNNNVGLAHRRLSIIDLATGHQPIYNEDKSIVIVFNGEIYNFEALRAKLIATGHQFRTSTDTEAIIHLYEEHDLNCLKYLRGMFAFALWDNNKERLLLARDRLGKKPLVYYASKESLTFASEIKALLVNEDIERQLDSDALDAYLSLLYVPAPLTMFKNIRRLLPGQYLVCQHGIIEHGRYWFPENTRQCYKPMEEHKQCIIDLLQEAVKIRLISDVPLGAFLSGGIDSSTVVALMTKISNTPVKTFSVGFDTEINELPYAKLVADKFQTEHTELMVHANVADDVNRIIDMYDEPFADSSAIPTYYISKLSKEYVTVVLNGDGGDELFAGYARYLFYHYERYYSLIPNFLRRMLCRLNYKNGIAGRILRHYRQLSEFTNLNSQQKALFTALYFQKNEKKLLYKQDFMESLRDFDLNSYLLENSSLNAYTTLSPLEYAMAFDMNVYLPNDLLVKIDIASMANSQEGRSPFLDHKLVEYVLSIPGNLKLYGSTTKYILKEAMKEILPESILRRKKQGFGPPLSYWLKTELKTFLSDTLNHNARCWDVFDRKFAYQIIDAFYSNQLVEPHKLWSILLFELWLRKFRVSI